MPELITLSAALQLKLDAENRIAACLHKELNELHAKTGIVPTDFEAGFAVGTNPEKTVFALVVNHCQITIPLGYTAGGYTEQGIPRFDKR